MAKNKIIILCILLISNLTCISCPYFSGRVKEIYSQEVGVREATGNNDGERVEEYLRVVGLGKGYAWCAAFVSWVFIQAEVPAPITAWSPSWFPASNTIYTRGSTTNKMPSTGDVFGLYYSNLKRIAHVGFVDEWQSNTSHVITVEGNTNDASSREGDGVYRKRRLKSQIYKVSRFL